MHAYLRMNVTFTKNFLAFRAYSLIAESCSWRADADNTYMLKSKHAKTFHGFRLGKHWVDIPFKPYFEFMAIKIREADAADSKAPTT